MSLYLKDVRGRGPLLNGIAVRIGEREYIMPPPGWGHISPEVLGLNEVGWTDLQHDQIELMLRTLADTLARNHPDVTADWLAERLNVATFRELWLTWLRGARITIVNAYSGSLN